MNKHVCFIAPYQELVELGKQANRILGADIQIKPGNLENGIMVAREVLRNKTKVIISRGGTASAIRREVDIPVVEIKVSGYDILKALYSFRETIAPIGIVGYQNVVTSCCSIAEIMNIPIKEYVLSGTESVNWPAVQKDIDEMIAQNGIRIIIGDTVIKNLKLRNLEVRLITSGLEAVIQAFEEAIQILRITELEKEKRKRFQAVLDFVHDGIVVANEKGTITFLNPLAEKVFLVKKEEALGKNIAEITLMTRINNVLNTGMPEIQQIQELDTSTIMTNTIPIVVDGGIKGVVVTFQEIAEIQDAEQKIRKNLHSKGLLARYSFRDILTCDPRMKKLIEVAKEYARTDATILIEGESGTGKEVLAQSIHAESSRASEPFLAINCAALPPLLLESELFGYEEGAFTGAKKGGKMGLFEMAHKGTIFLDEIGEMDHHIQARLLRVLEEKQVMRLGSSKIVPVNIRIISATNADLKKKVNEGQFRIDLYYRLNVLHLRTIPLREMKADIEYLALYYIRKYNELYGRQIEHLSSEVLDFLKEYQFPGNTRELKNVLERIVLTAKSDYITMESISFIVQELSSLNDTTQTQLEDILSGTMLEIKEKVIHKVLRQENYNKSYTARRLGIDRSTIERYIKNSERQ